VVYLARHANRADFVDPFWPETAERPDDPPLSHSGQTQAAELAARLAREPIDHLFASPFLRAVQTAHHIAETLDLPVRVEPGACEHLCTDYYDQAPEFLSPAQLAERFERVQADYQPLVVPTWPEDARQLRDRTRRCIEAILARYDGNVMIVGHGASVAGMARALVGEGTEITATLAGLVKINLIDDTWYLELNGDTSHLSEPGRGGLPLA